MNKKQLVGTLLAILGVVSAGAWKAGLIEVPAGACPPPPPCVCQ